MSVNGTPPPLGGEAGSFEALKSLLDRAPAERCELCGRALPPEHRHLVDPEKHAIVCACDPCSILFADDGRTAYRLVPRRVAFLEDFAMTEDQWTAFRIPVGLAFIFESSVTGRPQAYYPSPAGATESLLEFDDWTRLVDANPALATLRADVEALLVRRTRGVAEHYIAPIDACYELVGRLRSQWRGFSGGAEVWRDVGAFFDRLKARAGYVATER